MDQLLLDFINQCYSKALANGLEANLPIVIDYSTSEDFPLKIVIAHAEPVNLTLPLNVVWIVADENNGDDYYSALIRSSKQTSANYAHTWVKAVSIADINNLVQYYEGSDRFRYDPLQSLYNLGESGDPYPDRYLRLTGNQSVTGPIFVRELPNSQSYGSTEAIPRKTVVDAVNNQGQGFYAILMGMNNRLNTAEQRITNHEQRITALETGSGGGNSGGQFSGARYYIHVQNEASTEWLVNHQLGTKNIIVQVWKNDEMDPEVPEQMTMSEILAEEKVVFDDNFFLVRFNTQLTGRVVISTFDVEPT